MKKLLLATIAAFALCIGATAQEESEVYVGNGTDLSTVWQFPTQVNYTWHYSQTIYLAEEINAQGTITKMAWRPNFTTSSPRQLTLYVAETTLDHFESLTWADDELTEVWSGELSMVAGQWCEVELQVPFVYSGDANLLMAMLDETGSMDSWPAYYYGTTTAAIRTVRYGSDSEPISVENLPSPINNVNGFANMKLTIISGDVAVCAAPSGLNISDITSTTATITVVDSTESPVGTYLLQWKLYSDSWDDEDAVHEVQLSGSNLTVDLDDLLANTRYAVRVKSVCDADNSSGWRLASFRTSCGLITQLPWVADFEQDVVNTIPSCWNQLSASAGSSNELKVYNGNANSGSMCLRFNYSLSSGNVLALPEFEDEISNLELTFYHHPESRTNASCGTFEVGYLTDPTDETTFVAVGSWAYNDFTSENYRMEEVSFVNAPEGSRIAMRHRASNSNWYWHVDDVTVNHVSSCSRPTVSQVSVNIGEHSATLNWISTASNFVVYYRLQGTTQYDSVSDFADEGDGVFSAVITDLQPNSQYEYYVAAVCDDDVVKASSSYSFATPCDAITEFPWTFDMDDVPASNYGNIVSGGYIYMPCWRMYTGQFNPQTGTVNLAPPTFDVWAFVNTGMNGSTNIRCNIYGENNFRWLMSPVFTLEDQMTLEFDYSLTQYNSNTTPTEVGSDDQMWLLVSANGGASWEKLYSWGGNNTAFDAVLSSVTADISNIEIDLSDYAGQTVQFAFYGESIVSGGDNDFHIDNLVLSAGLCHRPSTPQLVDVSETEISIEWNTVEDDSNEWIVYLDGVQIGSTTTASYTFSGLNSATHYTIGVARVCADGDTSSITLFGAATLCGDITELPWEETFDNQSALDCWLNYHFDDGNSAWEIYTNGGYACTHFNSQEPANNWLISPAIVLPQTTDSIVLSFDMHGNTFQTYYTHARVLISTSDIDTSDFTVVLYDDQPEETYFTEYSFDISAYAGQTVYIAFVHDSYNDNGLSLDNVKLRQGGAHEGPTPQPQPECDAPTISNATSTTTTVTVAWTGSANSYQVGISQGSWQAPATPTSVGGTSHTFQNLAEATTYTVGVRAVCPDGVYSDWVTTTVTTEQGEQPNPGDDTTVVSIVTTTELSVSVYPNPASANVSISLGNDQQGSVAVIDQSGRTVSTHAMPNGSATIDLSGMARGAYYLRLTTATATTVRKLIVQ